MSRRNRTAAVSICCAALTLGLASPGLAQADDAHERNGVDSSEFAGYVSELGRKKSIVGTFTVPTLECDTTVAGVVSAIQIASTGGAEYASGEVFSFCFGEGHHVPKFHTNAGEFPIDEVVENGDRIRVSAKASEGAIEITMENLDHGWRATDTFQGVPAQEASSKQIVFENGGISLPVLDYGTLPVKGVRIGGKDLSQTNPTKYNLVINGLLIIKPGRIRQTDFKYSFVG